MPKDKRHGYLSEHHSFGRTAEVAGDFAEDLAATLLASTLGIAFDPLEAWDARKATRKRRDLQGSPHTPIFRGKQERLVDDRGCFWGIHSLKGMPLMKVSCNPVISRMLSKHGSTAHPK
jgi:hypothetical protein